MKSIAEKISPPGLSLPKVISLKETTFLTKSKSGLAIGLSNVLFPSSESPSF